MRPHSPAPSCPCPAVTAMMKGIVFALLAFAGVASGQQATVSVPAPLARRAILNTTSAPAPMPPSAGATATPSAMLVAGAAFAAAAAAARQW